MGRGRGTWRSLRQGGVGAAGELNAIVGAWHGVRIAPMFGRWGYFVGSELFACYPLKPKETDLWLRLTPADQRRALAVPGMRPHRRFAGRGWIEYEVTGLRQVGVAARWLRRGYDALVASGRAAAREDAQPGTERP